MRRDDSLSFRPANASDASLLLRWRNDDQTRTNSWNSGVVLPDEHERWLLGTLGDPRKTLLIAEIDGVPIGTVRGDRLDDAIELSWTVGPEFRGRGIGTRIVVGAIRHFGGRIVARIKVGNIQSAKIAERAGMRLARESKGIQEWST